MASFEFLAIILTGIGLTVSILYYTITLQNANKTQKLQLETRQAQLFMNIYNQYLQRENIKANDSVFHMEFESLEEFEEKYGRESNPEAYHDWSYHQNYWEGIGVLVREGLINIRLVALLDGGGIIYNWEKFEPIIKEYRKKYNWPRWSIEHEYHYNSVKKYSTEHPELEY